MTPVRVSSCFLVLFTACAQPGWVKPRLAPAAPLEGARELTVLSRWPEVGQMLEDTLRSRGYRIKRYVTRESVTEMTAPGRLRSYHEAATRYVLELGGELASLCDGRRGFRFNLLSVELVDTKINEVVLSLDGAGPSEGCGGSGPVFGGIAAAIDNAWVTADASKQSQSAAGGAEAVDPSQRNWIQLHDRGGVATEMDTTSISQRELGVEVRGRTIYSRPRSDSRIGGRRVAREYVMLDVHCASQRYRVIEATAVLADGKEMSLPVTGAWEKAPATDRGTMIARAACQRAASERSGARSQSP
jgi:hypothetical protein